MQMILCEYFSGDICSYEMLIHLLMILFTQLLRSYRDETGATSQEPPQHRLAEKMISFLEGNCASCTIEDLAREFSYSTVYIRELLRSASGKSFSELRQEFRLQSAAGLLKNTVLPIGEISQSVGYTNMSFFYRIFKEKYGKTPHDYREAIIKAK